MKIELHNVGPIEYFEFDTEKDLNLIYGKNSVGKSYAIYCVYNLLKNLYEPINVLGIRIGWKKSISILDGFYSKFFDRELIIKLKQEIDNSEKKVDVKEIILTTIKNIFQEYFIYNINQSFGNTFSSIKNLNNQLSKKDFLIKIQIGFISLDININNEKDTLQISNVFVKDSLEILYKNKELHHYQVFINDAIDDFSIHKENENEKDIFIEKIEKIVQSHLSKQLQKIDANIEKIHFLPSSRSGLYQALNSFTPILAELAKSRFQLKNKKIELPSLSEPIADYFIKLSTLDITKKSTTLEAIAQKIEEKILKGKINYDDEGKKINFSPDNTNLSLDLSESSSMVAEIAPLVTYLRYIINATTSDDILSNLFGRKESIYDTKILFIEEPEAHLHPEVQIQLMEIFVELTKLNVKVVITSHSNYMFQQLDNMILEGKIAPEKVASYHLVMGKNGSKDAEDMKATSEGMEDNNFVEISEKLYEKKMEIFDKLNADIINTD